MERIKELERTPLVLWVNYGAVEGWKPEPFEDRLSVIRFLQEGGPGFPWMLTRPVPLEELSKSDPTRPLERVAVCDAARQYVRRALSRPPEWRATADCAASWARLVDAVVALDKFPDPEPAALHNAHTTKLEAVTEPSPAEELAERIERELKSPELLTPDPAPLELLTPPDPESAPLPPWDFSPLPDELAAIVEDLEEAVEWIRTDRSEPSVVQEYLRRHFGSSSSSHGSALRLELWSLTFWNDAAGPHSAIILTLPLGFSSSDVATLGRGILEAEGFKPLTLKASSHGIIGEGETVEPLLEALRELRAVREL